MKIVIGALAICPLLVGPVFGNSWHVATDGYDQASGSYADPFLTIQHGIDMAANGDSVLVHDGTYSGDGNRDIDFLDKKIVVMSLNDDPAACIIQCDGSASKPHRGVHFDGLEDPTTVLRGLTVTGGYADEYGGGILFTESGVDTLPAPCVENCVLRENSAPQGAGFAVFGLSHPAFRDCQVITNDGPGGGWYPNEVDYYAGASLVEHCRFAFNTVGAELRGGWFVADPRFRYCELSGNVKDGLNVQVGYGSAFLESCIIMDNGGWGLHMIASGTKRDSSPGILRQNHLTFVLMNCAISDNGLGGITSGAETLVKVDNCTAVGNQGIGIGAYGVGRVDVQGCAALDNAGIGIDMGAGMLECHDNVVSRNSASGLILSCGYVGGVHHNLSHHNSGDGMVIGANVYRTLTVSSNTIVSNSGHGIAWSHSDSTVVHGNLVAFNEQAAFTCVSGDPPDLACSDFFGNLGGDWVGCIADQVDLRGNFSADPCFCDSLSGNYALCADSWCLPGHHPWGCDDLVGAVGQGCEACDCAAPGPTETTSWGSTKVLYR